MHERRYNNTIERLRLPERVERLEVDRVVSQSLNGQSFQSMLDVGTGSGIFAEAFSIKGLTTTGVDPNPEMLIAAKEFVPGGTFTVGTVESLPFPDNQFDLVFLGHVLHESDDITAALSECKRCATKRVAVLEWPYQTEETGPPLEHRLKSEEVISAAKKVGFRAYHVVQLNHMILFIFDL